MDVLIFILKHPEAVGAVVTSVATQITVAWLLFRDRWR